MTVPGQDLGWEVLNGDGPGDGKDGGFGGFADLVAAVMGGIARGEGEGERG